MVKIGPDDVVVTLSPGIVGECGGCVASVGIVGPWVGSVGIVAVPVGGGGGGVVEPMGESVAPPPWLLEVVVGSAGMEGGCGTVVSEMGGITPWPSCCMHLSSVQHLELHQRNK